jgi:hypothetical protein
MIHSRQLEEIAILALFFSGAHGCKGQISSPRPPLKKRFLINYYQLTNITKENSEWRSQRIGQLYR